MIDEHTVGARRVGVIGIGNMGLAMAMRLMDRGWSVGVCDIDPAQVAAAQAYGAAAHADAQALAEFSPVLIVAVVDAAQTRTVLLGGRGAISTLPRGATVLLCPTLAPTDVETLAHTLAGRGYRTIDAPMSGGPVRARDGSMSLMVACADATFEHWHGLLTDLSSRLFRIGPHPGDGARTKLVNNLLAAVNLVAAAEAMTLARRLGLDPRMTLDVIEQSSGQSLIGVERLRRVIEAGLGTELAVHAHMSLLAKDSALALAAARDAGFAPALGSGAAAVFAAACAQGLAQADDATLCQWLAQQR